MLPEAAEAKEAMNPGGIIAGAVADDGVVGKIFAQPHHDRAEIDGARLLGRRLRPGQIIGVRRFGVAARAGAGTSRLSSAAAKAVGVALIGSVGL